uniref:ATP synthase F0 subunit 8 n=1 Tax=Zorotypus medoensis TaxID=1264643 RepID=A0A0A7C3T4_9NEOP|nr:ATP synthase F0 subunit 8 [Zorotypus medoensis]AHY35143.1 ATP synthase F0 subunit 8 [Zorotypus medoensis]
MPQMATLNWMSLFITINLLIMIMKTTSIFFNKKYFTLMIIKTPSTKNWSW